MKVKVGNIVKWVVIIILLVILTIGLIINFAGNSIIKNAIEFGGTKALDVGVSVGDVDLSLTKAKFQINNLKVANPAGYKTKTMLELGSMTIDSSYGELLDDPAVIEEIILDEIQITLEQKGISNNIQDVLKNVSSRTPETAEEKEPAAESKKLKIKRLEIKGASVNAKLLPVGGAEQVVKFKLDPIIMNDLGTDEPVDVAIISSKVLAALVSGIVKQGAGILPADMTEAMGAGLEAATQILGQTAEIGQEALEQGQKAGKEILDKSKNVGKELKETGESVKKGLEGLFKKKD